MRVPKDDPLTSDEDRVDAYLGVVDFLFDVELGLLIWAQNLLQVIGERSAQTRLAEAGGGIYAIRDLGDKYLSNQGSLYEDKHRRNA